MAELAFLSLTRLSRLIGAGEVDPEDLMRLFLARAEGVGRSLNCYITLCKDSALSEAAAAAARALSRQRLGPLDGIPIAVKDNMDVAGVPTSNGFGGPPYRIPEKDSEIVRRLRAAGAIILGKLNMHEGALGSTNDNPHFGRTTNPHRDGHSPGGSSGGSGAAVAAGLCGAALGTDTGGSVRIPASYCGIVGLKPTFGLISTRGVVPLSYRLDHVGPLTRTVEDAAVMLDALAGPAEYLFPKPGRLDGVRLGVLENFSSVPQDPDVSAAFRAACDHFTRLGAEVRSIAMPAYDAIKGRRAGFLRVEVEAAFIHGDLYRREPERFSPQMRSYLDYGARVSATDLMRADRRIDAAVFELARCFEQVDAIVSPATPQAAPAFGDKPPDDAGTFCILANFAGAPAISVPMGRNARGLPLGLQLIGAPHQDARVLKIAAAFEGALGLQLYPPPPLGPAAGSP